MAKKNGLSDTKNSDGNWYYYTNGEIDKNYTGLAQNSQGWFYVKDGKIDFTFTGFAQNSGNWFWVVKGCIDFKHTGLYNDSEHGWYYVKDSKVDFTFTGLVQNSEGWFYVKDGEVDFTYTGFAQNGNNWFWVVKGYIDFKHTGLYNDSEHGWYYVKDSKIDFGANKFVKYTDNKWYWVENGHLDFKHTGLYHDSSKGWYYAKNSVIDFTCTRFVQNNVGWWWVDHGYVDMKHNGLYHDSTHGWWYVVNSIAASKQSAQFGLSNVCIDRKDTGEYYLTWNFTGNDVDSFKVIWEYSTFDTNGKYIQAASSSLPSTQLVASYTPPTEALIVRYTLQPIAQTKTVNGVSIAVWSCNKHTGTINIEERGVTPCKGDTPNVSSTEIGSITATINNISAEKDTVKYVRFKLYRINKYFVNGSWGGDYSLSCVTYKDIKWKITDGKDSYLSTTFGISKDDEKYPFKVSVTYINETRFGTLLYGEESELSDEVDVGISVTYNVTCKALSSTSVYISWPFYSNIKPDSWEIKYANKEEYLTGSNNAAQTVTVSSDDTVTGYTLTGLTTGKTYYFIIRPVRNGIKGFYGETASVTLGLPPTAPTTWSSTTTIMAGDNVTLYWVHNSKDNSLQTKAQINVWINDKLQTIDVNSIVPDEDDDASNKASSYLLNVSASATVKWQVRTAGVMREYGEWSITRVINVYDPVTLTVDITDKNGEALETVNKYPFYISVKPLPKTQSPLSYYVSIISNDAYESVDTYGNKKYVNVGESVYSKYFDTNEDLLIEITPAIVTLNGSYTVKCVVSMNSGIVKEEKKTFSVTQSESIPYVINMEIGVDESNYSTFLRPYAVTQIDENKLENVSGLEFSIYRREYDGTYTEIAKNIDSDENAYVPDPHPALNYARYRVVALDCSTGVMNYADIPDYPINCPYIIIQWNENWSSFISNSSNSFSVPVTNGSMLKLLYNVDTSESNSPDVELVEYVGRKNPVGYYGTQMGETATWNTDIVADDSETLYALRRLRKWMGNVYVREPSGIGYWANIKVSISKTHCELTIPVTLNITRVEGEM